MVVFKNITSEEYKSALREMIFDHYKERYGIEWIDSYIEYLQAKKPGKLRDLLIKDAKRYSTKEEQTNKDMNLLFDNRYNIGHNVAFGIFNNNILIGYMIFTIHAYFTPLMEIERYGELYRIYIKEEYREEFLKNNSRSNFVTSLEEYLIEYFRENNIEEILANIPTELDDLVSLGEDLGFIKYSHVKSNVSEKDKDLWIKRI